ncbi:hypothetical protein FOG24_29930 [Klebsiella grimontii]|nr:hypothetical protein [Klebsiella grimontii]
MRDLILQLSKSSIYSTKPRQCKRIYRPGAPPILANGSLFCYQWVLISQFLNMDTDSVTRL